MPVHAVQLNMAEVTKTKETPGPPCLLSLGRCSVSARCVTAHMPTMIKVISQLLSVLATCTFVACMLPGESQASRTLIRLSLAPQQNWWVATPLPDMSVSCCSVGLGETKQTGCSVAHQELFVLRRKATDVKDVCLSQQRLLQRSPGRYIRDARRPRTRLVYAQSADWPGEWRSEGCTTKNGI